MNKKIAFGLVFCGLLSLFIVPLMVSAEAPGGCTISGGNLERLASTGLNCSSTCNYDSNNDCGLCCLLSSVYNVTDWVFVLLMAFSTVMIIWGAFDFVRSGGSLEQTTAAKNRIIFAAVGIVVALFSRAVPSIIAMIVG